MKTTRRLLITSAFLLLGAYGIYTTVRVQRLETLLHQQQVSRSSTSQITYSFDDSFQDYFGEKGVAAVQQALLILQNPKTEPARRIEDFGFDFLADPLRIDGRSRTMRSTQQP